jgi:hypothetical protein
MGVLYRFEASTDLPFSRLTRVFPAYMNEVTMVCFISLYPCCRKEDMGRIATFVAPVANLEKAIVGKISKVIRESLFIKGRNGLKSIDAVENLISYGGIPIPFACTPLGLPAYEIELFKNVEI